MSGAVRTAGGDSSGVRLFAASARNLVPRLIANGATAGVGLMFFGWGWTILWFAVCWAVVFIGMALMRAIQAAGERRRAAVLNNLLTAVNVVSGTAACVMPVAMWLTGHELGRVYAMVTLFIGSAYVLLQYYANIRTFLTLIFPYAASFALVGGDVLARKGFTPVSIAILIASVLTLVNFFYLSQRTLEASRSALRKARAQARAGETAAESANEAKSAFLATMSHEIRTPLNGVLGMAQAMAVEPLAPRQRERLEIIHESGNALLAILNDILDLSKIEAGKLELEEIDFDLDEVARGAHSAFTAVANKKGLSFALDIDSARGAYRGDPTRLRQILSNLISNALKFTEHGEIRVVANYADGKLSIAVADTGVGIPAEALDKLFAKFSQVDVSTTRRFGGTGLGLAICQQLAGLMGGAIAVESREGKGSTFTLSLPMMRVGDESPTAPPPAAEPAACTDTDANHALRVLAAEDNSVNQLVLKTLLQQVGIDPVVVADGAAAVQAWEESHWDAILMDIQMPVMDGLAATRAIREKEKASGRAHTPIIALTANAMAHHVVEYRAAGFDDHVPKPLEAGRLFQALQTVMSASPATHTSAA
jgi:signal transduction histidine kinase/ActR/RegA family two-component response regulator